jgi:beta-lactamase regulating signal transducer with metallopeptidase domain
MPLFEASLRGALLIAILALLRAPLRRLIGSPWLCALWLVVLVRLAVPGPIQSTWSVFNWWPEKAVEKTGSTPLTARVTVLPESGSLVEGHTSAPLLAAPGNSSASKHDWLFTAWAIGACAAAAALGLRIFKTARMARSTQDADHPKLLSAFESIPLKLRKGVELQQSPSLEVPALVGLFRAQIWMPASWLDTMSEEELRHVLLHELGHARRGDLWVQWLFAVAQCIHWFNPAVWLAARLAHADRELACDAWVLRRAQNDEPERYGATLVKAAQLLHSTWHLPPAAITMAMSRRSLFSRVRSIGQFQPVAGWRALLGSISVTLLLGSLATDRLHAQSGGSAAGLGAGGPPAPAAGASDGAPSVTDAAPFHAPGGATYGIEPATTPAPAAGGLMGGASAGTAGSARQPQVEVQARFFQMPEAGWRELGVGGFSPEADNTIQVRGVMDPSSLHTFLARINSGGIGGVDLLSAPRVTTKSGQRAVIEIIREFRYGAEFVRDEKGVDGLTPTSFETRNVGVTLEAEPTLAPDGVTVDLSIAPQIVELTGFIRVRTGLPVPLKTEPGKKDGFFNATMPSDMVVQPLFSTRKVSTSVTLQSGETLVIGGLNQASASEPGEEPRVLFVLITARVINGSTPVGTVAQPGGLPKLERNSGPAGEVGAGIASPPTQPATGIGGAANPGLPGAGGGTGAFGNPNGVRPPPARGAPPPAQALPGTPGLAPGGAGIGRGYPPPVQPAPAIPGASPPATPYRLPGAPAGR